MSAYPSLDVSETLLLADVYEFIGLLKENGQYLEIRQLIEKRSDLIVSNWQSALCMTVLSHDYLVVKLFAKHILEKLVPSESHKVFAFLLELDRIVDLSNTYTHNTWIRSSTRVGLGSLQQSHMEAVSKTRKVIADILQNKIKVCVLYQNQSYTYLKASA